MATSVAGTVAAESKPTRDDPERLQQAIEEAITCADPVLCNLKVTRAHYELSNALRGVLGTETGPNFHTWAVWGSKKAGTTIRQEDVPGLSIAAAVAGAWIGLGAASLLARRNRRRWALATGAALGALVLRWFANKQLNQASNMILGGNVTVLDDIGHQTARFVATFQGGANPDMDDEALLQTFLSGLRPGPSTEGGQGLLAQAFTEYFRARQAREANTRDEAMLLGNLYAILHEHIRLQPYISGAMPRAVRRLITRSLLNFHLGLREMTVSRDVSPWQGDGGKAATENTLKHLENPDLIRFLVGGGGTHGWDRTPDSLSGSAAHDWTDIRDRMNYICDLFRERYFDPELFAAPFNDEQCAQLAEGKLPARPY